MYVPGVRAGRGRAGGVYARGCGVSGRAQAHVHVQGANEPAPRMKQLLPGASRPTPCSSLFSSFLLSLLSVQVSASSPCCQFLLSGPCSLFPASRFVASSSLLPVSKSLLPCFPIPCFQSAASSSLLPALRLPLHTSRPLLLRSSLLRLPCFSGPVPPAFLVQFRASSFQFLLPGPFSASRSFRSLLQDQDLRASSSALRSLPSFLVPCFHSRLQFPVFSSTIEVLYNVLLWNRWKRKGQRHFLKRLHNLRLVSETNSAKHQKVRC